MRQLRLERTNTAWNHLQVESNAALHTMSFWYEEFEG